MPENITPPKSHLSLNNDYGFLMNNALTNFKRLVAERGLSQYKVANDLGYSSAYFYNWTKGKGFPTLMSLCNIANYFDVSLIELLGYEKSNISETEKEILRRFNSLDARKQLDAIAMLVRMENIQHEEDLRYEAEFKKNKNQE